MSEGRRFQRLLTILNEVTTRPGLHPAELAEELGVSERTLRRDLAELRSAGFDLEWEEGYQLQERLALEDAAGGAGGTLPVLYEQQLRLVRGLYPELAERIQDYIREMMPEWKKTHEGVEAMTLAVMGCVVNGPGESKAASIGISLPGTGEEPSCPVYIDGHHVTTLRGTYDELAAAFQHLVDTYVDTTYAKKA